MLIRDLLPGELPAAASLLAGANETPYDVRVVAEEKLFGDGVDGPPRTRAAVSSGDLLGLAITSRRFLRILAVRPAARRGGIGTALLRDAEEWIARTSDQIEIAAEPGNYFTPGVFDGDTATAGFLAGHGYAPIASSVNLTADLVNGLPDVRPEPGPGIRRAEERERDRVLAFVSETFGRAWAFEASKAFGRQAGAPTLFLAEEGDRILGFAAHDANNRGLGFFGPAGVSSAARGRGIGRELLLSSLADLRRLGFGRATIAWAAAIDFYRAACGAEIAHHFVRYAKRIGSGV